ncbi:PREDICTED: uncharacterized protein LOC104704793 [Camelina sativa]|uniref:Uncharacterized protein LOC104704793 n=1 Tax=Camelina sativa TaxID=90675 RepID=A0ABM0T0W1_CAMSA|nr:PREDICTED: uncharacterized protein LOC104704793 [Camelina sativa]
MGDTEKNSRGSYDDMIELACFLISVACFIAFMGSIFYAVNQETPDYPVPNIEIASMDFTLRNITKTRLSANWDLLIRVPSNLPDLYICLQGDIQASLFYKNITLVTSSAQRVYNNFLFNLYNDLKYGSAQLLKVSASISEEDMGGLIGKNITKDIKKKREVKFGSQFFLTDCRKGTTEVLSYVCDEITLRFKPGSETNATKFGKNPICSNF